MEQASGGQDSETVAEAAARAPRLFRAMGRAVTADDYEALALQFGAGKARARGAGWNRIELFVAPAGGGFPSDTLKEQLRAQFRPRRMMTTIVDVRDPRYASVWIEATLCVEAYFFADQVRQQAENAVRALLDFDRVRFADRLYLSKVYEAIEGIEGVRAVSVERFATAATLVNLPSDGVLTFGYDEIPVAGFPEGIRFTQVIGGSMTLTAFTADSRCAATASTSRGSGAGSARGPPSARAPAARTAGPDEGYAVFDTGELFASPELPWQRVSRVRYLAAGSGAERGLVQASVAFFHDERPGCRPRWRSSSMTRPLRCSRSLGSTRSPPPTGCCRPGRGARRGDRDRAHSGWRGLRRPPAS